MITVGAFAAKPRSSSLEPNASCRAARLSVLQTFKLGFVADLDVCALPEEEIPAPLRPTLAQIGRLNDRIAEVLGVPVDELFGEGMKFSIQGKSSGPAGSMAGGVAVFPDWRGGELEPDVYAHEMTHDLLTFDRIPGLRDLSARNVLWETIPDTVATSVSGLPTLRLRDEAIPECARELHAPMASFLGLAEHDLRGAWAVRAGAACCDLHPEQALSNPRWKDRCKSLRESRARLDAELAASPALGAPADPQSCVMKGAHVRGGSFQGCDKHSFSPPFNAFMQALEKATGRPSLRLLVEALRRNEAEPVYSCRHVASGKTTSMYRIRSYRRGVERMREILVAGADGAAQAAHFDRLWQDHGMGFFARLDDIETLRKLQERLGRYEGVCMDGAGESCLYVCEVPKT